MIKFIHNIFGIHFWRAGGHTHEDWAIYCKVCNGESNVSPYGYAPLFFDGGIRCFANPIYTTPNDFKRLGNHCFPNLIEELK